MGFKNNQVDRIKKGLFVLAFALRFMIRALDLMDLSRKEVSVPFQALLLIWSIILLHFQATLRGIKITKDMLWEAGHGRGSFQEWVLTASLKLVSVIAPCSLYIKFSTVNYQMQTINADLHSWERKVGPLFLSSPPSPSFHSHFFPFQPWLFQTSSLPHEDMVKDHLSANNLPVSFPQFPLKGKPAAVGKSPQHLGTQSYSTRQERTEASAELGRTWLHGSCCGHTETRLPRVLRLGCSPAWSNRMVTMFCVHFLAGKGC